jgi:hypothetical protein
MAILIARDGSMRLVKPANGKAFSQEEIQLYGELRYVLLGNEIEMSTWGKRPEKIERVQ